MTEKLSIEELLAAATKATTSAKKRKAPRPKRRKKESRSGGGYTYIWIGNKQVLKHRWIMEKKVLKRDLLPHEAVYFLDGNKENFDLQNLKVGIKPGKFQQVVCPHCNKDIL